MDHQKEKTNILKTSKAFVWVLKSMPKEESPEIKKSRGTES